jgi:hypothetical protein
MELRREVESKEPELVPPAWARAGWIVAWIAIYVIGAAGVGLIAVSAWRLLTPTPDPIKHRYEAYNMNLPRDPDGRYRLEVGCYDDFEVGYFHRCYTRANGHLLVPKSNVGSNIGIDPDSANRAIAVDRGVFRCSDHSYCLHELAGATLADCGPGAELHAVGAPSPWLAFAVTPGAGARQCRVLFARAYADTPDCVVMQIPLAEGKASDESFSYGFTTTTVSIATSPGYRYLVTCRAGR